MEKQIFKKGDRVFDIRFGWGKVIKEEKGKIEVDFPRKQCCAFYNKSNIATLSFTEYTLQGHSQERPINYEDYIGKWGKFKSRGLKRFVIDKLKSVEFHEKNSFCAETDRTYYYEFEPLTEEQIKVLGLE
ncbi:hypothetical protein CAPN004_10430 [Capnocytophaga cynodegmi]|uniref:hypothetical protein n=1 Tax=Capnocytophaga cynodegmi TaxID=28189 RepID=UPI001AC30C1D|nr:hypothetical protein [Capnocytophaga cynodegmi]GIM52013.1 hypothetical protein CAPN004_10430 [Capnocytophaga cynodegmi]